MVSSARSEGRTSSLGEFPRGYRTAVSPRHVPASVTELARVGLFAELPGETLGKLADRMDREDVSSGTVLIREGEPGDRFFVLLSGVAGVSQSALGERRILKAGEFFGEVALAMRRAAHGDGHRDDAVRRRELRRGDVRRARAPLVRRRRVGQDGSPYGGSSLTTASAKSGHASFAHSPNSRVVSAAQTMRCIRIDPEERPGAAEVPERARRRSRAHPAGRSRVQLDAETPVERVEAAVVGEHAGEPRELHARPSRRASRRRRGAAQSSSRPIASTS